MRESTTVVLQRSLDRLRSGEDLARQEIMGFAKTRGKVLAVGMFSKNPVLYSLEHSYDLFQEAPLRLTQLLKTNGPDSIQGFRSLAWLQMRRRLRELIQKHFGRRSAIQRIHKTESVDAIGRDRLAGLTVADPGDALDLLIACTEFYETSGKLPEPERTVLDLLFDCDVPQEKTANLLSVSERDVRRNWLTARRRIGRKIGNCWPNL